MSNNETTCHTECDHDDICTDERICLTCGADMSETLFTAAYDRAKALRQDGD